MILTNPYGKLKTQREKTISKAVLEDIRCTVIQRAAWRSSLEGDTSPTGTGGQRKRQTWIRSSLKFGGRN